MDFKKFAERSMDLLCIADVNGYFTWLNETWTQLGWTLDELKSRPFVEFVHADDVQATFKEVARLADGLRTVRFVNRYRHKDGSWRWIEWNAWPDGDEVYASARDVTRLHSAIAAAQRQVHTLEVAERLGNFGHWRVTIGEDTVHWSPNVYRIHGRDPATFRPTMDEAIDAYHPDDRERVAKYVDDAIQTRTPFDFRLRIVRPSGDIRVVQSIGQAEVNSTTNEVESVFGVFRDMTEHEQAHRDRAEDLERFAYAAAHDLQAPLRTMMGFAQLLHEELGDVATGETLGYLDRLCGSADRMQQLVSGLYRYATLLGSEQGTEDVDLGALIEGIVAQRHADLEPAGVAVKIGDLPRVLGQPAPLNSLFSNLIDNAFKYRSADRPLQITIESSSSGPQAVIRVKDNGRGFDMRDADRAFGLFKQLQPRGRDGGLGMGLALCRKIAERHGGSVDVESARDVGSEFRVRLPLSSPVDESGEAA